MSAQFDDLLGKKIRSSFEDMEMDYQPADWDKLVAKMDGQRPGRVFYFPVWARAAVAVFAIGLSAWLVFSTFGTGEDADSNDQVVLNQQIVPADGPSENEAPGVGKTTEEGTVSGDDGNQSVDIQPPSGEAAQTLAATESAVPIDTLDAVDAENVLDQTIAAAEIQPPLPPVSGTGDLAAGGKPADDIPGRIIGVQVAEAAP